MKSYLTAAMIGATLLLGMSGMAQAQNAVEQKQPAEKTASFFDMFNPAQWRDASVDMKSGELMDFVPSDPKSWAKVIDPKTHSKFHMTVTNPQFYAKFMTPAHYFRFMEPKTWFSYMDPATYKPLMDVATDANTIAHWMQPGAYMHGMHPHGYLQMMNPDNYVKSAAKVVEGYKLDKSDNAENVFNPFSWMKKFADAASVLPESNTKSQ
jgi:hypothetical protein